MQRCNDNHDQIIYEGNECPLCKQRLLMDQLMDDREDVDQANIEDLFKEVKRLNRRLDGVELVLGIRRRKLWSLLPRRYARKSAEPWAETSTFQH